jgi:hypothetical protein
MSSEKIANAAATTLNGAIDNATITVVVTSAAAFPAAGQFRILIDNEILLVTGVAGNTFTVAARGTIEGTAAAAHLTLAPVTHVLTKGAFDQILADNMQAGPFASLPAPEKAGRQYQTTDGNYRFYDTGTVWKALGPIYNFTLPPAATGGPSPTAFAFINQGAITLSTAGGGIYLQAPPNAADSWTFLVKTIPATPYAVNIFVEPMVLGQNYGGTAMVLRDSITGNFSAFQQYWIGTSLTLTVGHGTPAGPTITVDDAVGPPISRVYNWMQIADDGTTRTYKISKDGFNWMPFYSQAHATPFVPDQIGIGLEARNPKYYVGLGLSSWQEQ